MKIENGTTARLGWCRLKFIEMVFDQKLINISEVFSRYKIDKAALKKIFELLNQTHNETVFEELRYVQSLLRMQQVSKSVDRRLQKLGLPSYFRDLTEKEEALSRNRFVLHFGSYWSYSLIMCFTYLLRLVHIIFLLFLDDCIVGRLLHSLHILLWKSVKIIYNHRELGCTIPMDDTEIWSGIEIPWLNLRYIYESHLSLCNPVAKQKEWARYSKIISYSTAYEGLGHCSLANNLPNTF